MTKQLSKMTYVIFIIAGYITLTGLYIFLNYQFDKNQLLKNIPEGIHITKTLAAQYDITITGDCGRGVFEISEFTSQAITSQGINYLNQHTTRLADINNIHVLHRDKYKYEKWHKRIFPKPYFPSEGCVTKKNFFSFSSLNPELYERLYESEKINELYYTKGGYGNGFLIRIYPKQKILIINVDLR